MNAEEIIVSCNNQDDSNKWLSLKDIVMFSNHITIVRKGESLELEIEYVNWFTRVLNICSLRFGSRMCYAAMRCAIENNRRIDSKDLDFMVF